MILFRDPISSLYFGRYFIWWVTYSYLSNASRSKYLDIVNVFTTPRKPSTAQTTKTKKRPLSKGDEEGETVEHNESGSPEGQ